MRARLGCSRSSRVRMVLRAWRSCRREGGGGGGEGGGRVQASSHENTREGKRARLCQVLQLRTRVFSGLGQHRNLLGRNNIALLSTTSHPTSGRPHPPTSRPASSLQPLSGQRPPLPFCPPPTSRVSATAGSMLLSISIGSGRGMSMARSGPRASTLRRAATAVALQPQGREKAQRLACQFSKDHASTAPLTWLASPPSPGWHLPPHSNTKQPPLSLPHT